jgi:hypothetical protein
MTDTTPPATKKCSKCLLEKPLEDFHSNVAKPGSKDPMCRKCRNEYNRRYYHQHIEENRERSRRYAEQHREEMSVKNKRKYIENKAGIDARNKAYNKTERGREVLRETLKRYRERHPDALKETRKRYREKDEERYLKLHAQQQRKTRKTPSGKVAESRHRHRRAELTKKTQCTLTLKQWDRILVMQSNRCADCKAAFSDENPPTKDHIIPLSKGGGLTFGNVQALCASCNSKKHDKVDFMIAIDKLLTPAGACEC